MLPCVTATKTDLIEIEYYGNDDLQRLLACIGLKSDETIKKL